VSRFLIEGNTRVAVASDVGVPSVRAEVHYFNGGEMVEGQFAPENVAGIAASKPVENYRDGGQVMMRSDMSSQMEGGIGGLSDRLVDSMTQALMRYRQGNFIQLPTDDWEDRSDSVRVRVYY
jgi:hypothetical protein